MKALGSLSFLDAARIAGARAGHIHTRREHRISLSREAQKPGSYSVSAGFFDEFGRYRHTFLGNLTIT